MLKRYIYPFSAIIGQEKMKSALLLNAVDPSIGGVLISGHKGTGKSTAVRALARILPEIEAVQGCPFHCPADDPSRMCDGCREKIAAGQPPSLIKRTMPVVELPLSATEDRVVGTLHVEHALKTGQRRFDPGLMAAANRGILYVDEVNLLDDHLVDILLDAAASGVNIVEREGISHTHPAGFMLVGTMNPEEGDLRPQILDRFGLSLTVTSLMAAGIRQQIVRQRMAFDQDPEAFLEQWSAAERILSGQIIRARKTLVSVGIPDAMLALAVRLSTEVKVQGHRSDIVILKTARALAAMLEKTEVAREHIIEAARYALPHRIANAPLATPERLQEQLDQALSRVLGNPDVPTRPGPDEVEPDWDDVSTVVPGPMAISHADMIFSFLEKKKRFLTPMNSSAPTTSTARPSVSGELPPGS